MAIPPQYWAGPGEGYAAVIALSASRVGGATFLSALRAEDGGAGATGRLVSGLFATWESGFQRSGALGQEVFTELEQGAHGGRWEAIAKGEAALLGDGTRARVLQ